MTQAEQIVEHLLEEDDEKKMPAWLAKIKGKKDGEGDGDDGDDKESEGDGEKKESSDSKGGGGGGSKGSSETVKKTW